MKFIGSIGAALAYLAICAVALFCLYVMFVIMPVVFYADIKCKEAGYPKSEVTINLQKWCMNLDGSVTVKMERLK